MDLQGLQSGAQAASENVAKFQEDIPGLLSGLKTNLTSIFTKDNPMMAQRETALQDYLNTPSSTRASLLPANQPMVEGSPLNFSPTQQNAIVEARRNAALVPLAGLNSSIVGQYGNLGDILNAAAQSYQSQLDAAKSRATSAQDLYKLAVAQDQFDRQLALDRYKADQSSGGGMGDLFKQYQDSLKRQQNGQGNGSTFKPDNQPTTTPYTIPGVDEFQLDNNPQLSNLSSDLPLNYNPNQGAGRWNPLDQFGALWQLFGQMGGQQNSVDPNQYATGNNPNSLYFAGR